MSSIMQNKDNIKHLCEIIDFGVIGMNIDEMFVDKLVNNVNNYKNNNNELPINTSIFISNLKHSIENNPNWFALFLEDIKDNDKSLQTIIKAYLTALLNNSSTEIFIILNDDYLDNHASTYSFQINYKCQDIIGKIIIYQKGYYYFICPFFDDEVNNIADLIKYLDIQK